MHSGKKAVWNESGKKSNNSILKKKIEINNFTNIKVMQRILYYLDTEGLT